MPKGKCRHFGNCRNGVTGDEHHDDLHGSVPLAVPTSGSSDIGLGDTTAGGWTSFSDPSSWPSFHLIYLASRSTVNRSSIRPNRRACPRSLKSA